MKSCILASFAIATGIPEEVLVKYVGHDGSEVLFPNDPDDVNRRGFHVQELLYVGIRLGHHFTPLEFVYGYKSQRDPTAKEVFVASDAREAYIYDTMRVSSGFITGIVQKTHHAVAFKLGKVFDRGKTYSVNDLLKFDFRPHTAWIRA